jgi:hypothetical protein
MGSATAKRKAMLEKKKHIDHEAKIKVPMFRCFIPGAPKSLGTDRVQGHTGGETKCLVESFMPSIVHDTE